MDGGVYFRPSQPLVPLKTFGCSGSASNQSINQSTFVKRRKSRANRRRVIEPCWASSQRSPDPIAGEEGMLPPPPKKKTPAPLSAFGLDFRPFGLHSAASPTVSIPTILIKHCTGTPIGANYTLYSEKFTSTLGEGDSLHPAQSWSPATQYSPPGLNIFPRLCPNVTRFGSSLDSYQFRIATKYFIKFRQ